MKRVTKVSEVRSALAESRSAGGRIGLVPTMGALHEGHLSLVRRARADCDVVVVSLFVNPTQFDERADLDAYPRDEAHDEALARHEGADLLFVPAAAEVYPPGFATTVSVAGITESLEGAARGRGHFEGVATVVTKLLNIVGPDVAYFGQKDAQQAHVITRLVADLDIPTVIEVCPTVRETDGLALSSRNVRLTGQERTQAASLHRALEAIVGAAADGERDPVAARGRGMSELEAAGVVPEYLELVSSETFQPVGEIDGGALAVVAARVGGTRLIDNEPIPAPRAGHSRDGRP